MAIKNVIVGYKNVDGLRVNGFIGRIINRMISISKIRNTTASKKNRREKGVRADPAGSNPHS